MWLRLWNLTWFWFDESLLDKYRKCGWSGRRLGVCESGLMSELLPLCLQRVSCHISAYAATSYITLVETTYLSSSKPDLKRKQTVWFLNLTQTTNV